MTQIIPVILCGGSGTRLWPSSRKAFPKQFSPLLGTRSLFQQTLRRLSGKMFAEPLVLTNEDFRFLVRDQAAEIGLADARIVLEPQARDTGPAILTAALLLKDTPEALMLVAPSDHLIEDQAAFLQAIEHGAAAAGSGKLVTFGIAPDGPETGYGYLQLSGPSAGGKAVALERFVEKPDAARAADMVAGGKHLWNAGIFLFRVGDILKAFDTHAADMIAPAQEAIAKAKEDLGFLRLDAQAYGQARAQSFDYAVMEKASDIAAVPVDAGWSDLGSWTAIYDVAEADADGVVTQGEAVALECENTLLRSEEGNIQLVGLGLKDVVAVAMRDAVLVADKSQAQKVKQVVEKLRAIKAPQADDYPRFYRPWGWYETLCLGSRFQVKRIMVKPGGVLSLQSHVHRSEHWVVVEGTARVTVGKEIKLLSENESVYIPLGAVHRMENPGKVPMYLIEVQTGSYLGEDDIERYEDIYDRS